MIVGLYLFYLELASGTKLLCICDCNVCNRIKVIKIFTANRIMIRQYLLDCN